MVEWHGHGVTGLVAGFKIHGLFVEDGRCAHLNFGMQAHGYSSCKQGDGQIMMHLKCKHCYDEYVKMREAEAVCCNDCNTFFMRSMTSLYTPYSHPDLSEEEAQLIICAGCWENDIHQDRLAQDREAQVDEADGDVNVWDPGMGLEPPDEPSMPSETMECSDCGNEFHPSELKRYVPVDLGEGTLAEQTLHICPECANEPRHEGRLREDQLARAEGTVSKR